MRNDADGIIRRVEPGDVPTVVTLVHELAEYEKAADECSLSSDQLEQALFGPHPALFGHVAEIQHAQGAQVVGFALWFLNFSTWDGVHGIYLEDLFVRPEHRGSGLGRALLAELAAECVRNGYSRLQWWVLHWNEPALRFYRSIGAQPMDEWSVQRVSGDDLPTLARSARSA